MGLRFVDTTVTIGGVTYETFTPDARLTARCAWSPAVIRWGYPDSLEAPTPSTVTLRLTVPDGLSLPAYGERVIVSTRYQTYNAFGPTYTSPPLVQFTGEADGANRARATLTTSVEERNGTTRVEGWGITLTASGDFARLARTPLSDQPWPEQPAWERLARIAQLVADRVNLGPGGSNLVGESGSGYLVRARDVDAFAALEAILLTISPETNLLYERATGPELVALDVLPELLRYAAGGPAWIERYDTNPTATYWLSANCLEDGSRDLNTESVVNVASVRYPVPPAVPGEDYAETTYTARDTGSAALYGDSEWSTSTDALYAPDVMAPRLQRAIAARATEQWTVPNPARVLLDQVTGPYGYRLLPSAPGQPLLLTDTPPDVDPFQRVIGGTLTLHGDPEQQALDVNLEPARNAANAVLTLNDLSDFPINTLTQVTIRDLGDVSNAQVI